MAESMLEASFSGGPLRGEHRMVKLSQVTLDVYADGQMHRYIRQATSVSTDTTRYRYVGPVAES
jgi:hypothetical protein